MEVITDAPLQVRILGRVAASRGQVEIDLGAPKQRALFTLLAIRANRRVGLDEVVGTLWHDDPPRSAPQLVHTYVARLRQALEPGSPRRRRTNVITSSPGGYRLTLEEDSLDLLTFRTLTRKALLLAESPGWQTALDLFHRALREWHDVSLREIEVLLPNRHDADVLRREWLEAGTEFVRLGLVHGVPATVLPVAEQLARIEPLDETVQRLHLEVLGRTGRRAAALACYAEVRHRLRAELGIDPGTQLTAIFQDLLREPAGNDTADSGPPHRPRWDGAGTAVEDLVGRDENTGDLVRLLGRQPLLTLTGPPGSGKSATASAVARIARSHFADGVTVVDLSTARTAADLTAALCAVVRPAAGTTAPRRAADVADLLTGRHALIVLDNAERVVDDCCRFVDRLLRRSPSVKVLVTSRELLGLPYETVRQVPPLPVPGPRDADDLDRLRANPSVALFARRAAQVRADFAVEKDNAAQVVTVCRQLDGLPLALELAAASLRTRDLAWVAERLDDPLHALGALRRGGPGHHRSLRAALLHSAGSLDPAEARLLAAVSSLADDFCPLLAGHAVPGEPGVQTVLDRLVDKSLLAVRHDPDGTRYRMLRTVRALGRELGARPAAG